MLIHSPTRMPIHPALATYLHDLSPFVFRLGEGFGVRWYGLAYVAAFVAAYAICLHLSSRGFSDIAPDAVGDFITGTALFGVILGGRLGYMVFYDWPRFSSDPLIFFKFWEGGMASHGGILGIVAFTWFYARRKKIPWLNVGDSIVVAAPVGLFLGRCANFINGELYGRPATVPWAVQFPNEVYAMDPARSGTLLQNALQANPAWNSLPALVENSSDPRLAEILSRYLTPRHPSQIYEALLEGGLLFGLLWILRTRARLPDGVLTGVFFIAYAVLRILGEFFREPDAPLTGLLTRGQFLSVFLIGIGVAFLIASKLRPTWAPKFR